jgi:L-threonylcarbamoyladenylate synthase
LEEDIRNALEILRNGGIILYPTDTIWGIGCDATNPVAVEKIYRLKMRNEFKPMLILIDDASRILSYIDTMPEIAWDLIELAEKPITIIYPGAKNLAHNIIAPDKTIGIRVCNDPFVKNLIQRLRKPLVSTSANISGKPFQNTFSAIDPIIRTGVDYTVKYRQSEKSLYSPSSIIQLGVKGEVRVIRK